MAEQLEFRLITVDQATQTIRNLRNELRQLQTEQQSYISGFRRFEGISAWREQEQAIRANIRAVEELTAAQRDAQRFMQAQASLSAQRAQNLLFPREAFDNIHGYESAVRDAADKVDGHLGRFGQSARHLVAIFDESMRGQRGAIISSVSAMARDSGALEAVWRSLATPWGAVAIAGIAALTAIGVALEQAFQKTRDLRDETTNLALKGFGTSPQQQLDLSSQFDRNKAATSEWAGTIRDLDNELRKLPAAAIPLKQQFVDLATSLSGLKHIEPEKAIEAVVKAAEHGPEALAKFVEEEFNLKGVLDSSGMTLSEHVRVLVDTTEKYRAILAALNQVRGPILEVGHAARESQQSWEKYKDALIVAEGGILAADAMVQKQADDIRKNTDALHGMTEASDALAQVQRDLAVEIDKVNKVLDDREKALRTLQAVQGEAARRGGEVGEFGDPTAAQRAGNAARQLEAEQRKSRLQPAEEEEHQRRMQNIQAEAEARRADLAAQVRAADARMQEEERIARLRFPGGDVSKDNEVQKARDAAAEARRRQSDQTRDLEIDNLRAVAAEEARGSASRVAAQQKIIEITRQQVAEGRKSATDLANEETRLANLKRQLANKTFQEARDNMRAEVELAKGSVDQIIAAYAKLRDAAQATGQTPATQAQINREEIRDLESAQSQKFTRVTEYNSAVEKLGEIQTQAERARLAIEVAQHKMSKDQAALAEEQFNSRVMAEAEQRIETELQNDTLTADQKERLYNHLSELYAKDAENQMKAQERATQAIEAENQKRLKSFQTMFDSIGSASEKLFEGLFDKSKTRGELFQDFGRSIFKSLTTEVGHLGSQYLGGQLAKTLGVSMEGASDTGIGAVLSRALGNALGITRTSTGQEGLKGVADKWQNALNAQNHATELYHDAAQKLIEAGEKLNNAASQRGVRGGYGTGGGSVGYGPLADTGSSGQERILDLIEQYESSGRNIPNYRYDRTHTAQGYFQITNSTWRQFAQAGGVDVGQFPNAMSASYDQQRSVARAILQSEGTGPWANFNPALAQALQNIQTLGTTSKQTAVNLQNTGTAEQQNATAVQQAGTAANDNAQAVQRDSSALQQHSQAAQQTTTVVGGSGGGGVIGGLQSLSGQLSRVNPAFGAFSSVLGVAQSAVQLFSAATSAASAGKAVGGILGLGGILGIFERGGIVPSAAGGMISAGGLSILHPREMVLPAHISTGLQNMIDRSPGANFGGNSFTYNANVTGYHPYATRSSFEGMLRTHGSAMQAWVENSMRNGWRPAA